jgi:hypothetical protein
MEFVEFVEFVTADAVEVDVSPADSSVGSDDMGSSKICDLDRKEHALSPVRHNFAQKPARGNGTSFKMRRLR